MAKVSQPKKRQWSFKQLLRHRSTGKQLTLPDTVPSVHVTRNDGYLQKHTGGLSMLPHKIVGDIMRMIVHDQFSSHSKRGADGKAYTWLPQALHVCRYLRSVAFVNVQLNETEDATSLDNQATHPVLQEMHRIKSLQFHGTTLHSDLLCLILRIEAPCLENLVMTSLNFSELPVPFFGNPVSCGKDMNLKRLFVFNTLVPTQPHVLQNLQFLKINRSRISFHFQHVHRLTNCWCPESMPEPRRFRIQ
ncbi:hypothetical protein BD410DRAFT_168294 [Rickenella mellea]|uniref:F-box domain-containing protein n=1 Tax=Rickenella mellea TaxID=50990 RepID=A0A4Y7PJJ5_9AGAM|nr:hypothetical protein BD410DRAFT_168294 [Rickenella mellea]